MQKQYTSYMVGYNDITVTNYAGNVITTNSISSGSGSMHYPRYFTPGWNISAGEDPLAVGLVRITNGTTKYSGTASNSSVTACTGVILGDGSGTPSINDYKLFGNIITDFSASTSLSVSIAGDKILITTVYIITNTGSSPFTIKEMGLTRASDGNTTATYVLLLHDVLETPLTINPGETKTLCYKLYTY